MTRIERELKKKDLMIFRVPMDYFKYGKTKKDIKKEIFRRKLICLMKQGN